MVELLNLLAARITVDRIEQSLESSHIKLGEATPSECCGDRTILPKKRKHLQLPETRWLE
jgi:hypothetical protein